MYTLVTLNSLNNFKNVFIETVNLKTKTADKLVVSGRHDPCIVKRAVPVIEAVAAISILNMLDNN